MRNLKKVLALALAVVMLVGMMVVGASAAGYADVAADNDYGTAISVVSAIKAIEGSNGKYNPNGNLTRADASVIAARVALTRGYTNNLAGVTAAYTDVSAKAYYAGAVAWATNEGIIAGNGDGTFKPGSKVTGYAFAKMMLGVLGYDAEIEGYQNDKDYLININYDAAKAGLLTGLEDLDLSAKLTRGQAAQMAFNAIQAQRVTEYETVIMPVNGEWTAIQKAIVPEKAVNDNSLLDDVYTNIHTFTTDSTPNNPSTTYWIMDGALEPLSAVCEIAPTAINVKSDLSKLNLATKTVEVEGVEVTVGVEAKVNGTLTGTDLANTDAVKALCVPGNTVEIYVDQNEIVAVNVTSETLVDVTGEYDDATETYTFYLATKAGAALDATMGTIRFSDAEDADNTLYNALVALELNLRGDKILVSTNAGIITSVEKAITATGKVTKYVEDEVVTVNGVEHALGVQYAEHDAIAIKAEQVLYLDHAGNVLTAVNVPPADVVPNAIYVSKVTTTPVWVEDIDAETEGNQPGYTTDGTFTITGFNLAGESVTIVSGATATPATLYTYVYNDTTYVYDLTPAGSALQNYTGTATDRTVIYTNDVREATDTYFFAENVTFLYIYDTDGAGPKGITVNGIYDGVQQVNGGVSYIYLLDDDYFVTHVIVKGAHYEETVYEDGVVYVDAELNVDNIDYYAIAEDGKTATSNYVVLMGGEEFVIAQKKGEESTVSAGFYQYRYDTKGLVILNDWDDTNYSYVNFNLNVDGTEGSDGKVLLVNGRYYVQETDGYLIDITDADVYCMDQQTACSSVARLYTLANSSQYGAVTVSYRYNFRNGESSNVEIYVNSIVEPA